MEHHYDAARELKEKMARLGMRVELDDRNEKNGVTRFVHLKLKKSLIN